MLEGPGVKLHDPHGGATRPGPLHPRPWEGGRETVANRTSSRGFRIAERSSVRRRFHITGKKVGEIRTKIEAGHSGLPFDRFQKLDRQQIAASKPAVDYRLTFVDQTPECRLRTSSANGAG